jgi:hypothetical protein
MGVIQKKVAIKIKYAVLRKKVLGRRWAFMI